MRPNNKQDGGKACRAHHLCPANNQARLQTLVESYRRHVVKPTTEFTFNWVDSSKKGSAEHGRYHDCLQCWSQEEKVRVDVARDGQIPGRLMTG